MRAIGRIRIDHLALAISSLTAYATAQLDAALSESCYLTTTVIYGSASNWITFSGSTSSSPVSASVSSSLSGSSQSGVLSPVFTSTFPSVAASTTVNPSSTTATTSISLTTPFIVQVGGFGNSKARRRSNEYLTFVNALAYLSPNQDDAAVFQIRADGQMLSGGEYVGTESHSGSSNLELDAGLQPDGYMWSFVGTTLKFGNTTFARLPDGQIVIVFGDGPPPAGAVEVAMAPQFVAITTSSLMISYTPTASIGSTSTSLGQQSLTSGGKSASPSAGISSSVSGSTSTKAITSLSTAPIDTTQSPQTSALTTTGATSPSSPTSASVAPSSSSTPNESSSVPTVTTPTATSSTRTISAAGTSTSAGLGSSSSVLSTILGSSTTSTSMGGVSSTATPLSTVSPTTSTFSVPPTPQSTIAGSSTSISRTTTQLTSTTPSTSSTSSSVSATITTTTTPRLTTSTSTSSRQLSSSTTTTTTTTMIAHTSSVSTSSASPSTTYPAKRGLAYTNVTTLQYYPPPSPYISWSYNYYSLPNASDNVGAYPSTEFRYIPLLYNDADSLTSIWSGNVNQSIAQYGADAIFGFNEPDACYQSKSACMALPDVLQGYALYMQPFSGRVQIGAPAVTNSGAPSGLYYLNEFIGNATQMGLTVDFVNLHWYASPYNFDYFMSYVEGAYEMFGGKYPVWISEFGMDQSNYDQGDVVAFMENATTWMDEQDWIVRYAWFGNFPGDGTTEYLLNSAGTARGILGNVWYG